MAHFWKIAASRHSHLPPFAQLTSKLSLALVIFWLLRTCVFPASSSFAFVPTVVLVLMVAGALRNQRSRFAQLIMPTTTESGSVLSEAGQRQALLRAVAGLELYKERTGALLTRRYALFSKMPTRHRKIAEQTGYLDRLGELDQRIAANAKIVAGLVRFAKKRHNIKDYELRVVANPVSNGSVIELLNHYVRDWAVDQAGEREELFRPLLECLEEEFADTASRRHKRVMVPGSGLARAAYEIAQLGFKTEALEYSHLMDLAAQFVYNLPGHLPLTGDDGKPQQFEFFPYVHEFSHQETKAHQLRGVRVPDVAGTPLRKPKTLTLGYGDFTALANDPAHAGQYDSIVTLFLLDTAENALAYLDALHLLLKPGGVWINYGPLKWGSAPQVEFNLDELHQALPQLGFVVERTWRGKNQYNGDRKSLWEAAYKIRGWKARKVDVL